MPAVAPPVPVDNGSSEVSQQRLEQHPARLVYSGRACQAGKYVTVSRFSDCRFQKGLVNVHPQPVSAAADAVAGPFLPLLFADFSRRPSTFSLANSDAFSSVSSSPLVLFVVLPVAVSSVSSDADADTVCPCRSSISRVVPVAPSESLPRPRPPPSSPRRPSSSSEEDRTRF